MFRRRRKLSEPRELLDEALARNVLYGSHTRSGDPVHVWLTPLFPDEDGRPAGIDSLWKDWDSISFDWPSAVFNEEADTHSVSFKKYLTTSLKSGETLRVTGYRLSF